MENTDKIGRFLQDTLDINFKDMGVRRDIAGRMPLYLKGIVSIHEGTLNERPHLLCFYSSEVTSSSFSPVKVAKEIKSRSSIPGWYRGKNCVFEFIKEPNGDINHRLFSPFK
jgi:hypothetical protein